MDMNPTHSGSRWTPLWAILGAPGEPPECKVISDDVAMHWYPQGATPGDACLCGARTKTGDHDA